MKINEDTLALWACEAGFAKAALCRPDGFFQTQQIVQEQAELRERKQLRFFPEDDYPQIKSLAVLLWPYAPAEHPEGENLFIDSYYAASNAAYHASKSLEVRLNAAGVFAKANVAYPAKEAAVRAGLGIIGKSSLLITPEFGTRTVIILMATGIPVSVDVAAYQSKSSCLNCGRCAGVCPSGALDASGMAHPEKCLRNYMMEGIVVPEFLREKMGMKLIGCDACQRVCPLQQSHRQVQAPSCSLGQFVTDDPDLFSAAVARLAATIGKNAARPQRVRAQAALLAGNSRNPAYLPVLRSWTESPFEAVQIHAKWAIEQIELESNRT